MNHYERLKVNPEAPPEVIRAAYRALAAKLHPDRKGGDAGPNEHAHEEMAALNASYLVLMDEQARADYDRTLHSQARPLVSPEPTSAGGRQDAGDTRIDIDWLMAMPNAAAPWYRDPRWLFAVLSFGGMMLAGLAWWGAQEVERHEFDRSLARRGTLEQTAPQEGTQGAVATVPAAAGAASTPELTPEQLSAMSDDELLAAMPKLLNDSPRADTSHPSLTTPTGASHPLDGQPLGLKSAPMTLPSLRSSAP